MKRDSERKEFLYRKKNAKARGVFHNSGGDFSNTRNGKEKNSSTVKMKKDVHRGLDYTPLFRFLLSKVGKNWEEVYKEAQSRLDREEPIWWIVGEDDLGAKEYVRIGESTYYSRLTVDENGLLQKVDKTFGPQSLEPTCPCCTHTFNGVPFTKKFRSIKK